MDKEIFLNLLKERILILDGGMGTMVQGFKLTEKDYRGKQFADWTSDLKGNNDLLCITRPDVIKSIHRQYLDAGADIFATNTFNANAISMEDYGMQGQVRNINLAAGKLAREVADGFMKEHPECSLHVSTLHSSEAYSYVGNRSVDIAFITDPIYSSSVGTHILFKEKLCLVAGKELNLPEHVRIRELDPQLEIRTMWDRNFEAWHSYFFGDKAIPRMYLDEMGFLQYFTQSGDNWAFLPISIARTVLRDAPVSIHTLDVEPPSRTLYYLDRLDDRSPYQEHLLRLCRQKLSQEEGIRVEEE